MVTIVFALAVVNLGLGFALALVLDRLPMWSMPRNQRPPKAESSSPLEVAETEVDVPASAPGDEWSQKLLAAEVEPKSDLERLLWIVKLETGWRRERVIELDRMFFDPHSPKRIELDLNQELTSFHHLLEAWVAQADAIKGQVGSGVESLEELLLDQAFQVRSCIEALAETGRDDVARQLAMAMTAFNVLRDRADALLSELLLSEDRLHSVASRYRTFGDRETLTHLGLAAMFDEWWADDPDHVRLVSVVMLDLDRFEPFTQQVGAARGDIALLRFGDMLHDLLRKERGYDRVARFSGQRFVMFLGDTSSKNAAKGAERIRQTIEATTFKFGGAATEVTASVAVVEPGSKEEPSDFIARLESMLNGCKRAGRNCGYADFGDGPEPIRLPQYQVSVHVIELDGQAAA